MLHSYTSCPFILMADEISLEESLHAHNIKRLLTAL